MPMHPIDAVTSPDAIAAIEMRRQQITQQMKEKYGISPQSIGEIGYRLGARPPEEIIAAGGLVSDKSLSLTNVPGSPLHTGLVDFTVIPEVTGIYTAYRKEAQPYIYAMPLEEGYLMPGPWRQVSVAALPLPEAFYARQVIGHNPDGSLSLGPVLAYGDTLTLRHDASLNAFLACDKLSVPQDIALGDEFSTPVYDIERFDNEASRRLFPEGVLKHRNVSQGRRNL